MAGGREEGKIAKRGKARSKEVTGFLPQQALLMHYGQLKNQMRHVVSSSLLLGISKFSFVRRKQ